MNNNKFNLIFEPDIEGFIPEFCTRRYKFCKCDSRFVIDDPKNLRVAILIEIRSSILKIIIIFILFLVISYFKLFKNYTGSIKSKI